MEYAYESNEFIFFLKINVDDKKTYCKHCFFQLLSDEYTKISKINDMDKSKWHDLFDKINQNQYGIYDKNTGKWEIIDIFPVPGCKGVKHEVTHN